MKHSVIGFDIDGVIVDIGTAMLPIFSEVCQRCLEYKDLCSWYVGKALNIDENTMNLTWERFHKSEVLQYAPPIEGAIDGLSLLKDHEIWLVTSRPISTRDFTLSWLNDNKVHYDHIVFDRHGDKVSVGPKFNVFVEGFLDEALRISKYNVFTILFDQPWNQESKLPNNCKRAYNWDDVVSLINAL